jgi:ABC-type branched-subunit amino acid transport system ATPase component
LPGRWGPNPTCFLLDEVAAGLTEAEVHDVMDLVAQLRAGGADHYLDRTLD